MATALFRVLRVHDRTGKQKLAELFGESEREKAYGKSTVYYWLDPRAEERCPPPEFVLWLAKRVEKHASVATARCA